MAYLRRLAFIAIAAAFVSLPGMALAETQPISHTPVVNGIGDPRSITQTPSFGAISEQIAMALPPGRRNLFPKLSFTYLSGGGVGVAGVGWQLEAGHVDRSTRNGVPSFTDADLFNLSVGGSSSDLVAVGTGIYRAKFEAQYRLAAKVGDSWLVREAQGTLYKFGSSPDSKVTDASGTLTSSWMLDFIQDANGNTITFKYIRDHGSLYISEIDYTGYAPTSDPGYYKVTFDYDSRPDQRKNFSTGVESDLFLRLQRVSVFAGSALVRRYVVNYGVSPTNGRSLVASLVLVGDDDTSTVTARQYQYQSRAVGWPTASVGALPFSLSASDGHDLGVRLVDVNGDDFVDVVNSDNSVFLGDGTGAFTESALWSGSIAAIGIPFVVQVGGNPGLDNGVRLIDVNGDGRPDVLVANLSTQAVYLNNGDGWTLDPVYSASIAGLQETSEVGDGAVETVPFSIVGEDSDSLGVQFADVNGDSLPDIVWSFQITSGLTGTSPLATDAGIAAREPQTIAAVYLNTGTGFVRDGVRSSALKTAVPDTFVKNTEVQGFDLLDVNGDGLADIVRTLDGSSRIVLINTGNGWTQDPDFTASLTAASNIVSLSSDLKSLGLLPVDYNNDGLLDYIRSDSTVTIAYKNTGLGWAVDDAMTAALTTLGLKVVDSNNAPTGVVMADVDGDGIVDLVQARDGSTNAIHLAVGPFPDLLSHAVSALGETTDIAYSSSAAFDNTGGDSIQDLTTVLQVATSLTRGDGRGNTFHSSFSYAGGLQLDRKLRGFANATVIDPRGVTQNLQFFQDEPRIGLIASAQTIDTLGNVRSQKTSTYQLATPVTGVTQAQLIQFDDETDDPATADHPAGSLHTRVRTTYDQFMNVIEVDKDGDVTVTGDEGRTVMQHVQNLALNIVDPVSRLSTFDAAGHLVSQTITLYDGLPEGQVSAGNPTFEIDSIVIGGATTSHPTTFDKFGNVLTVSDGAKRVVGTFVYDGTTNALRTKVTDANGRVVQSSYDLRFGIPTSEIDLNGHTQTRALDAFGRLVRETMPGDEASPFGTQTITYGPLGDPATQTIRTDSTTTAGTSNTLATTTFYDGFAQAYRIETPGEGGQVVDLTTEFDDAGNAAITSRPFFGGTTPALTTYTRDALRRLTTVTEPDGIAHTIAYYGTTSDVVDRRGNLKRFVRDAYGKVLEDHQFVAGADQVTRYQYDSTGNPLVITDALGEVTKISYDAIGRRTSINDPSMGTFRYYYDAAGNLASQTDSDGKVTTFVYDAARQLVQKNLSDRRVIRFQYDVSKATNSIGKVGKVEDDAGTLDIAYDLRGHVATRRRQIDGQTYATGYAYDSLERLRQVIYPDGYLVNYAYNPAGNVNQITDATGAHIVSNVAYDASGAITDLKLGNGIDSQRTYDLLSRLNRLTTATSGGTLIQDRQNAYDPVANVTSITDFAFGRSQTFTYDEKNRLTSAIGAYGSETYQYDAIGNLQKKGSILMNDDPTRLQQVTCGIDTTALPPNGHSMSGGGPVVAGDDVLLAACLHALRSRPLDPADLGAVKAIQAVHNPSRLESSTTFVAAYDRRGNMTRNNDTNYVYDSENHLLQVVQGGYVIEENVYDAAGNRVLRKTNPGQGNGAVTVFVDGIFEMDANDAFRHVSIGQMVVASVRTAAAAVRLVSNVTPGVFAVSTEAPSSSSGCACGVGGVPSHSSLFLLGLGIGAVVLYRGRSRRFWRRAGQAGMSAIAEAHRRPGRWLIALLLVPSYLAYSNNVRGDSAPNLSLGQQAEYFYYHLDHVGNVEAISNQKGQVVKRLQYKPFGEQFTDQVNPHQSGFLDANDPHARDLNRSFNGHDLDVATGLYYFGARHYNPIVGRFLTADTKTNDPENPQDLHRYAFNLNNPIRNIDLTGHGWWDVILGIVVVVLIVVAAVVVSIGTAGVGDAVFGVALGILIGAGVGLAVGTIAAYAKYGNLTSVASLRLILATTFAGELTGAAIGFMAGVGLGAAFNANTLAVWATHDLITNVLLGAAFGSIGGIIGGNPADKNFARDLFLGTGIGIGVGVVAGVSDYLTVWVVGAGAGSALEGWLGGIISTLQATASFYSANNYVCKQENGKCLAQIQPSTNLSNGRTTSSTTTLSAVRESGVPAWSFDGTILGGETMSFIGRDQLDMYPLSP